MIHLHTSKKFTEDLTKSGCDLTCVENGVAWHWYAHRITLLHKKCVIVMEGESRYALVFAGLKKKDFSRFDQMLRERILAEARWLCDLQPEANKRLMTKLEEKSAAVFCSQGLDRSVQSHIRQAGDELYSLIHYRFGRLPETPEEEIALGAIVNDTLRKRGCDKDYFFPQQKWRESLLALLASPEKTNVVNLADFRKDREDA